jgi:hypothetical protein
MKTEKNVFDLTRFLLVLNHEVIISFSSWKRVNLGLVKESFTSDPEAIPSSS